MLQPQPHQHSTGRALTVPPQLGLSASRRSSRQASWRCVWSVAHQPCCQLVLSGCPTRQGVFHTRPAANTTTVRNRPKCTSKHNRRSWKQYRTVQPMQKQHSQHSQHRPWRYHNPSGTARKPAGPAGHVIKPSMPFRCYLDSLDA